MVGLVWWSRIIRDLKETCPMVSDWSSGVAMVRGKWRGIFESAKTFSVWVCLSNFVGVCSPRIRQSKREYSATARQALSVLAVVRVRSPLGAK